MAGLIAAGIAGVLGGGASSVIGGVLGNYFGGRAKDRDIRRLQGLGLTPQEIVGSGAGSGGPGGAGQTLGNIPDIMQARQQRYEAGQRDLDRQAQLAGVTIQSESAQNVARLNAAASMRNTDQQVSLGHRRQDQVEHEYVRRGDTTSEAGIWEHRRQQQAVPNVRSEIVLSNVSRKLGFSPLRPPNRPLTSYERDVILSAYAELGLIDGGPSTAVYSALGSLVSDWYSSPPPSSPPPSVLGGPSPTMPRPKPPQRLPFSLPGSRDTFR